MNITVKQYSTTALIPVQLGRSIMKASEVRTMYKRIYKENWQQHFYQWQLWNTSAGKKQFNKYVKGL